MYVHLPGAAGRTGLVHEAAALDMRNQQVKEAAGFTAAGVYHLVAPYTQKRSA